MLKEYFLKSVPLGAPAVLRVKLSGIFIDTFKENQFSH